MHPKFLKCVLVAAILASAAPALADGDASLKQVYEAAESGHVDQAQQMMTQVLRDHPESGTAHFVKAELDAKQGQFSDAKSELATAERLEPGLPKVNQNSVRALEAELNPGASSRPQPVAHGSSIPWGFIIFLVIIGGIIMMFMRRRRQVVVPYGSNSGGYMQPGMGGGYGPASGGMGSGIVGGLASGLAVGAGVVAGEEIAHHFLDGDRRPNDSYSPDNSGSNSDPNANMGGNDFGVSDSGSWDDNSADSGGGGGGGDDWS